MAVGVIIGGAFTTIVNSLVKDIFMPILGIIIGKINFSNLKIVLTSAGDGNVEAAIYYGSFIQNTINFLLISLVIFTFIKQMNRFRNKEEENKPKETEKLDVSLEVELLTEIRDLLKSNRNLSEIDKDNI